MSIKKQPKPNTIIPIITEIEEDHYRIKNWVAREWLPIIGVHAMALYNIYSASANRERGNSWFFSLRTLEEFTFLSNPTINMNNWMLELCGLMRINSGKDGYANEYVLLTPPHVTPELLKQIMVTLKAESDMGKNWQVFKANALERIIKWKPLHECGKMSQFKKGMIEAKKQPLATNTDKSVPTAMPPQTDLVARLVAEFKGNKLTEAAASKMITDYGEEAVKQQLAWLPQRETDMPLRTLRAALKGNWDEPKPVGKPVMETEMMGAPPPDSPPQAAPPPVETGPALSLPPDPQWQEVKARLEMQLPQATYNNWVKQTELVQIEGNQWLIQCESTFAQDWLGNRLNGTLMRTVASVAGQNVALKFVVNDKELGKLNG